MLRWRLISAAVIVAVLVGFVVLDFRASGDHPGVWLLPMLLVATVLASGELLDLFAARGWRPSKTVVIGGNLLIVLTSSVSVWGGWMSFSLLPETLAETLAATFVALAAGLLLAFIAEMRRFEAPGDAILRVALSSFSFVYVGVAVTFLVLLRTFESNGQGMAALLSLIIVAKMSDVGAYTFGRLFGRHKMAPILSPGKTWEGTIGGVATACLASCLLFEFLTPFLTGQPSHVGWLSRFVFGALIAITGSLGDLAESLIKRDMGRKDSSRWLPGLGGVLDIVDSLLAAAPWAYLCWAIGLVS